MCVCVCAAYLFILRADRAGRSKKGCNPPPAQPTPEMKQWSRRYMSHSSLVPTGLQRAQFLRSISEIYWGLSLWFDLFSHPFAMWTFSTADTFAQCPRAPLTRSRAGIRGKTHQGLHKLPRKEAIPTWKHVKANKKGRRTWSWSDLPVVTHYQEKHENLLSWPAVRCCLPPHHYWNGMITVHVGNTALQPQCQVDILISMDS